MTVGRKKVILAMSGGVDSGVSAALLERQGFEIEGVYMRLNKSSKGAERMAKKIAKILGVPFRVLNFEKEFKKRVIDYFFEEIRAGRTPNPCVVCNKEIKFGLLMEKAVKMGADYIATGHYARLRKIKTPAQNSKIFKLFKAKDKNKDQSYFLWKFSQRQLSRVIFPVGDYTRAQVEEMARKFKLLLSGVKKSVEICFIPKNVNDFLEKYLKKNPGNIVDKERRVLGQHEGLQFYTLGQRKRIGLAGGPYYVIGKNVKGGDLIVSKNEKDLLRKEIFLKDVSWISGRAPCLPLKISVKVRYRSEAGFAVLTKNSARTFRIRFRNPQRAATPGQSAVFYRGQELLGGGIII